MKKPLIVLATLALGTTLLTGCPQAATPAADSGQLAACVLKDWGQPVATIAHDCTQDAVPLAIDIIALLSNALSKNPTTAPASKTYTSDDRVAARMTALEAPAAK